MNKIGTKAVGREWKKVELPSENGHLGWNLAEDFDIWGGEKRGKAAFLYWFGRMGENPVERGRTKFLFKPGLCDYNKTRKGYKMKFIGGEIPCVKS
ncbi:MAG: hypothetical protein SOR61_01395 [Evtepia sp.]|uniref:hypothetical protein n=1 Tax=Evtepia sp. TaxID=2773933 RepID=UPI002A76622E|nr:hypothetical protein [Evtepia sp.]MDY3013855.1 hypothetical protein [Evtepia sp.]